MWREGEDKRTRSKWYVPFFFQKDWRIVGIDVKQAVLSILNSGHMLRKMNYTHIVLIPKINEPKCLANYKPINLGNVVYRIPSKK